MEHGHFTIIGVAGDVRISSLDSDPPPMIYDSMFQVQSGASTRMAFVIRLAHANAESEQGIFNAVRKQIWSVDKDLPAYDNTTLAALVSESVAQRRFTTMLMSAFAGVALLLAAIGLFGVISYLVSERTRELAVRVALGADARQIGWMVAPWFHFGTRGLWDRTGHFHGDIAMAAIEPVRREPFRSAHADARPSAAARRYACRSLLAGAARNEGRSDDGFAASIKEWADGQCRLNKDRGVCSRLSSLGPPWRMLTSRRSRSGPGDLLFAGGREQQVPRAAEIRSFLLRHLPGGARDDN